MNFLCFLIEEMYMGLLRLCSPSVFAWPAILLPVLHCVVCATIPNDAARNQVLSPQSRWYMKFGQTGSLRGDHIQSRVKPSAESGLVPVDVRRFNALNSAIVALMPAVAVANDTLNRVVPLLRQMQQLLSQRPHGTGRPGYRILHRLRGIVVGATPATRAADLPSWSMWLQAYAIELNYSVRHLQRLIYAEPRKKTIKKCGWCQRPQSVDRRRRFGA